MKHSFRWDRLAELGLWILGICAVIFIPLAIGNFIKPLLLTQGFDKDTPSWGAGFVTILCLASVVYLGVLIRALIRALHDWLTEPKEVG